MLCKSLFVFRPGFKQLGAASVIFFVMLALSKKPPFIEQSQAMSAMNPSVTVFVDDFDPANFSESEFAD